MDKLRYATLCLLLALSWQWLTVTSNYGGNWTALFCTGGNLKVPPQLASEDIYVFPNSNGYDGQFYHYIAHDPLLRGELHRYIDAPRMRYRRILLPGMAYLAALGQQEFIDAAYMAVSMAFLFLGAWWLSAYAETQGRHPGWGAAYLLLPSSIISVDRLTVDHTLTALTVGFAIYAVRKPSWKLYAVLILVPLARETGLLLTGAYVVWCLSVRQWRRAAVFATSTAPWLAWSLYVWSRTESAAYPTSFVPFQGILQALVEPVDYPFPASAATLVQTGDVLALAGMLLAIALATQCLARRRPLSAPVVACLLYTGLAVFFQRGDMWDNVYPYGRLFSPFLFLVAAAWLSSSRWLAALPVVLILPRLLMQLGKQALGIAEALRSAF